MRACAAPLISSSSVRRAPAPRSTTSIGDVDAPAAPQADAGRLAGRAVERAIALAQRGDVDGIVTAPLDKHALLAGGYDFPGHTEMLAALTGCRVAMMLAATRPAPGATNPLRVVLATTHIALRDVPRLAHRRRHRRRRAT